MKAWVPIFFSLMVCGWTLVAGTALAAGFRCGTKLVSRDDTKMEVLHKCGEPDSVETWTEERSRYSRYRLTPDSNRKTEKKGHYGNRFTHRKSVAIEEWTYNLGPSRFMRFLTFENGKLTALETGDYGY